MRLAVIRPAVTVILLLLSALLSTAGAQHPPAASRIGYLSPLSSSDPARQSRFEAFRQGLRELGYVEGQNIAIESRWAEGQYDRYPALAADLVRSKVDVIVAVSAAEGRQYLRNDATRAVAASRRRREDSLALLRSLTPEQWQRGCLHPTAGRRTINQFVTLLAWHDDNHLDQLRRALEGKA